MIRIEEVFVWTETGSSDQCNHFIDKFIIELEFVRYRDLKQSRTEVMTHGQQVKYRNNLSYEKVSDYVLNIAIINTLLDIKYAVNFLCLMLNPPFSACRAGVRLLHYVKLYTITDYDSIADFDSDC